MKYMTAGEPLKTITTSSCDIDTIANKGSIGPESNNFMSFRGVDSEKADDFEEKQVSPQTINRKVFVGAGARINQKVQQDPLGIEAWCEKPVAIIRLYFCFETQFLDIVEKGGAKEIVNEKKGYLKDVKVG